MNRSAPAAAAAAENVLFNIFLLPRNFEKEKRENDDRELADKKIDKNIPEN
jgi:hypothetical protein